MLFKCKCLQPILHQCCLYYCRWIIFYRHPSVHSIAVQFYIDYQMQKSTSSPNCMVKPSQQWKKFITHSDCWNWTFPPNSKAFSTRRRQMSSLAHTWILGISFWQKVSVDAKKQINLTKQKTKQDQVLLFPAPSPEEYVLLNSFFVEEKARQEILEGKKRHFPQFFCPVRVVCWPAKDHSLLR